MGLIKGKSVFLHVREVIGVDEFNNPIEATSKIKVDNVVIGQPSSNEVLDVLNLYGKKLSYVLCIPKGDSNNWVDTKVEFWGETFQTIGYPEEFQEELVPLDWNKKVKVARYE